MSTFDKIEIGRRALFAAQSGQRSTGQNVANVNTEGYKRQSIVQSSSAAEYDGRTNGVGVDGVKQAQDEFLERKILSSNSELRNSTTKAEILRNLEIIYNDRNGQGISNAMAELWGAWSELATSPESGPFRMNLAEKAINLTEKFNRFHSETSDFKKELVKGLTAEIHDVNNWANEIAGLNKKVANIEARGGNANELKDQRDRLAGNISDKVDIQRSYNKNGRLHIEFGGGHTLVDGDEAYQLDLNYNANSSEKVAIILKLQKTTNMDITQFIKQGETSEKVKMVNEYIPSVINKFDDLANSVKDEVNSLYVTGTPLDEAFKNLVSASNFKPEYVNDEIDGLKLGQLTLNIVDEDGYSSGQISVEIKPDDTAQSIAFKINEAANINNTNSNLEDVPLTAAVIGQKFEINSRSNYGFYIAEDTSSAMSKLGINAFFTGNNGVKDLQVNQQLLDSPEKIAAGVKMLPGNNDVALQISELRYATPLNNGSESFSEFYDRAITDMALDLQSSKKSSEVQQETLDQYKVMRQEVSGVSLDEEMANMIKYQRAYEASAKFSGIADEMLNTTINFR